MTAGARLSDRFLALHRPGVGGFAFAALAAVVDAARELREDGTAGYLERTSAGSGSARGVLVRGLGVSR